MKRALFAALMTLAVAAFAALGIWQLERRAWKMDLIAATEGRVHAQPGPALPPEAWSGLTPQADAYRRVRVVGTWLHDRETLVQALTELGAGFWVLTPLRTEAGWTVLVNRGFVPADRVDPASRGAGQPTGTVAVTGLLRITEPKGGFLRSNNPAADRWFSRDVAAIAGARRIANAAPYFIDADATPNPGGLPVGGLTVISFTNNHLVYALTWFSLAALSVVALLRVLRPARPNLLEPNPIEVDRLEL